MSRQHWICIVAAMVGGVAAGTMGLSWLDAPPPSSSWSMTTGTGTGYILLAALGAACVGTLALLQRRGRLASVLLFAAGIVPGLVEPRAFVATFLLVFAGLLASSLPKPRTSSTIGGSSSRRASARPSRA